ncbi:hypothetical protein K449DRAFT_464101 [Hypoxylon sp. EC38]|nr:hypothetical protein K449DRAFT_464101 [Hypoxylon sp. EC38]
MPANQFAAHVADGIVGNSKGGLVWKGLNAETTKLTTKWFPKPLWLQDSAMTEDQGNRQAHSGFFQVEVISIT